MKHTEVKITFAYEGEAYHAIDTASRIISPLSGGATFTEGKGVWRNDGGKLIWDKVIVVTVTVAAYLPELWRGVAGFLAKEFNQECVVLQRSEVEFELVDA